MAAEKIKIGDLVSFNFAGKGGMGEVITSPTTTHALVAIIPDETDAHLKGPHRFTLWCELAALIILPPPKATVSTFPPDPVHCAHARPEGQPCPHCLGINDSFPGKEGP